MYQTNIIIVLSCAYKCTQGFVLLIYVYTHMHAYSHMGICSYLPMYILNHMYACTHTYTHMCTCEHKLTHACTHVCVHTYTHPLLIHNAGYNTVQSCFHDGRTDHA